MGNQILYKWEVCQAYKSRLTWSKLFADMFYYQESNHGLGMINHFRRQQSSKLPTKILTETQSTSVERAELYCQAHVQRRRALVCMKKCAQSTTKPSSTSVRDA